jgi:hypothetical protein
VLVRGLHAPSQSAPVPDDPLCCDFLCFCCFLLLSHTVMGVFCFYFVFWVIASLADFLVFRSDVFQLRSTNFRRPLHLTLHSIGFSVLFPSTQHQPLRCPTFSRRRVQPTRQIWSSCVLIIIVTRLLDRCFVITLCFLFFLSCNLFSWVLVSLGDPFTGFFVLLFVVPVLFHIHISARPSLLKGLFWTRLKASAWVMPLFNTDLVSNPLCADC